MNQNDFVISAYGVAVPKLIYGTAWKKERTAGLVAQAVKLGFRGLDTACQPKHYDEPGVGSGLAECLEAGLARSDVYLQTKFTPVDGQDPRRMPYDPKAKLSLQIAQSFASSLANLQTDYLDGLILHSPCQQDWQTLEVWQAMEAIFDDGGAKQLGISNCYRLETLENLYLKAKVKPAIVQNRFYAATQYDREIREFCRQHQIYYQSFWTLTANPHILSHGLLQQLSAHYGRTPEQVFFRYLTQIDIIPLTGTTQEAHMREDLAIFDFELAASDCAALARLLPGA
jgi:diketogulonate reductase-like aldo/keto reductase